MSTGEAAQQIGVDQGTHLRGENGRTMQLGRATAALAVLPKTKPECPMLDLFDAWPV